MNDYKIIAEHMLQELKNSQNPTAFINTIFKIDDDEDKANLYSYGDDLSNDFKKYIGDGYAWVQYIGKNNGTFIVMFSCGPDVDMNKFEKNKQLASLLTSKPTRFDIDDILKMMSIEISEVNDNFDEELANILTMGAVLVMN